MVSYARLLDSSGEVGYRYRALGRTGSSGGVMTDDLFNSSERLPTRLWPSRFHRFTAPAFFVADTAGDVIPAIASAAELIRGGAA